MTIRQGRNGRKAGSKRIGSFAMYVLAVFFLFFALAFLSPRNSMMGKVWAQSGTAVLLLLQANGYQVYDAWSYFNVQEQMAKDKANFAEEIADYLSIISGWLDIKTIFSKWFKITDDTEKTAAAIDTAAQQATASGDVKRTEAILDGKVQDVQLGGMTRIAGEKALPNPAEQTLCNKVLTCQLAPALADYARAVSRMTGEGIAMRYRCKECDGNGPQYGSDFAKARFFDNHIKLGSPEDAPTGGVDPQEGRINKGLYDADVSHNVLARDSILEVPPMKEETRQTISGDTIKINVPDPDYTNEEQVMWLAARQKCLQLAGPRPSPPVGNDLSDPRLISRRLQWENCAAMQNAFVKLCTDRIGKLSRPPCATDDDNQAEICYIVKQSCDAAREFNVDLSENFQDCVNGVNYYQAEYLCMMLCGTRRHVQAEKMTGASDATIIGNKALCSMLKSSYEVQMQEEEENFTRAVEGIKGLGECWAAVGNM